MNLKDLIDQIFPWAGIYLSIILSTRTYTQNIIIDNLISLAFAYLALTILNHFYRRKPVNKLQKQLKTK